MDGTTSILILDKSKRFGRPLKFNIPPSQKNIPFDPILFIKRGHSITCASFHSNPVHSSFNSNHYNNHGHDKQHQHGRRSFSSIDNQSKNIPSRLILNLSTINLLEIFQMINSSFFYDKKLNPRRVLTKPSKPSQNNGFDNEKNDYILYVNDIIGNEEGRKYLILDLLGQGTFGQVVKCQNTKSKEMVAIKVIKNQSAYFNQSMMEVTVLELLNQKYDKDDRHHIVRMRDTFVFRQHLCIVVELLSLNLYDLIKQNQYRGFSLALCRAFITQILDAMCIMKESRIIHCDLKPENILLKNLESPYIKVIDYGSACHENQTLYSYIQSRFYRSPEVLLGLPYSSAIDMWSLGCIAGELFLGLPIFPGASNYDQISRIVESLGIPPAHMIELGKDAHIYFEKRQTSDGRTRTFLKQRDKYNMETHKNEIPSKKYFSSTNIEEIILSYTMRPRDTIQRDRETELENRKCFVNFILGLLNYNPLERWSPYQARMHPFITGRPFTGKFVPPIPQISIPIVEIGTGIGGERGPLPRIRTRANTLSSLSLQDVPGPLQKISTTQKGQEAPPIGERTALPPEDMIIHGGSGSFGSGIINSSGIGSGANGFFFNNGSESMENMMPLALQNNNSLLSINNNSIGMGNGNETNFSPSITNGTRGMFNHSSSQYYHQPNPASQSSSSNINNYYVERVAAYHSNRRQSNPMIIPSSSSSYALPSSMPNNYQRKNSSVSNVNNGSGNGNNNNNSNYIGGTLKKSVTNSFLASMTINHRDEEEEKSREDKEKRDEKVEVMERKKCQDNKLT